MADEIPRLLLDGRLLGGVDDRQGAIEGLVATYNLKTMEGSLTRWVK